jgi:hypothetical protein
MRVNALQYIDQVSVRINVVQSAGDNQALDGTDTFRADFRPVKQPVLFPQRDLQFILPISEPQLSFTIDGTHYTKNKSDGFIANAEQAVISSMLNQHRVLLYGCHNGCLILLSAPL